MRRGVGICTGRWPEADATKAQIDQLELEVQALKAMLQNQSAPPSTSVPDSATINQLVDQRLKEKETENAARKKAEEDAKPLQGFVVGNDRKLNVTWDAGGFRFKSADNVFNLHMGGRLMSDQVWWTQSPDLRKPPVQPAGSPLSQQTGVGLALAICKMAFSSAVLASSRTAPSSK